MGVIQAPMEEFSSFSSLMSKLTFSNQALQFACNAWACKMANTLKDKYLAWIRCGEIYKFSSILLRFGVIKI